MRLSMKMGPITVVVYLLVRESVLKKSWLPYRLALAADAGSVYDPHPTMTLEWDPNSDDSSPSTRRKRESNPSQHATLSPHPSNPHSVINAGLYMNGNANGIVASMQKMTIRAEELWVYAGVGG